MTNTNMLDQIKIKASNLSWYNEYRKFWERVKKEAKEAKRGR